MLGTSPACTQRTVRSSPPVPATTSGSPLRRPGSSSARRTVMPVSRAARPSFPLFPPLSMDRTLPARTVRGHLAARPPGVPSAGRDVVVEPEHVVRVVSPLQLPQPAGVPGAQTGRHPVRALVADEVEVDRAGAPRPDVGADVPHPADAAFVVGRVLPHPERVHRPRGVPEG